MSAKISKNHHYIPKAILRRFCLSGNSILIASSKDGQFCVEKKNLDRAFQRFHLNSTQDSLGKRDDKLEKFFAHELDNYIPEWLKVFEAARTSGTIRFPTNKSRYRFIQFFYNHMRRSPEFIDPIVQQVSAEVLHENLAEEFERNVRSITPQARTLLRDESWRNRVIANSRVESVSQQTASILDTLEGMTIVIAEPLREAKQFIVASNPVVRFEDFPLQPLGREGVELWTTLSPRIALGFVSKKRIARVLRLDDTQIRKLNLSLVRQSKLIAGTSRPLLFSLSQRAWSSR